MRFMLIVKATKETEAGVPPSQELVDRMLKFNEQLVNAGVLLGAEGLHPSSNAVRITYPVPGGDAVITDGPFAETKELIAGFWLIEVKSREEAVQWALRIPYPDDGGDGQIEVRQVFGEEEVSQDPETLAKGTTLRERAAQQKSS